MAAAPRSPADVLTFWFGPEWAQNRQALSTAEYGASPERMRLWWSGDAAGDAACANFAALVHAAGRGELVDGEWQASPESSLAKVLLLDQVARGAFRGTPAAFQYDDVAIKETLAAIDSGFDANMQAFELQFALMPLMHSEDPKHHEVSVRKYTQLVEKHPDVPALKFALQYAQDHAAVVQRFGHYPHRNAAKGRETTPEEAAWLASPECPAWAKSQLKKL